MSCHSGFVNEINSYDKACPFREDAQRLSSCPFLSGDTLRMIADWRFDETSQQIAPGKVRPGDVIFVKTDFLSAFFQKVHPHIVNKYILVSHNSDFSAPANFGSYLNDTNLAYWFAQNCDSAASNLVPVPIGLENRRWKTAEEFEYFLDRARNPKHLHERSTLLFVSLGNTNPARAKKIENVRSQNVSVVAERLSFRAYVDAVSNSKFVMSPPGNGVDCHRTWEVSAGAACLTTNAAS